jgi:plastocyanin
VNEVEPAIAPARSATALARFGLSSFRNGRFDRQSTRMEEFIFAQREYPLVAASLSREASKSWRSSTPLTLQGIGTLTRNLEGRLSRANIGWLAAAIFIVFVGMTFVLLFDQTVVAWADANANVGISNFAFTPAALTVKSGETVTFENRDSTVHSIVGVGGSFRSKPLDTDDKFTFTFDKPGEYSYFCGLHPYMKGKVVVLQ